MSTVAQLAPRVLRKLGLGIVANADRQADGPTLTQAQVVSRVMRNMGIVVPESLRPPSSGTLTSTEIAERVLRALGVNPVANAPDAGGIITRQEIASRALRSIGVNPADLNPGALSTVEYDFHAVATEALLRLGVISPEETPATADQSYAETRALSVHDMLARLDYVTWSDFAIPQSVFEAYVSLTANLIAPAYGKPASPETAALGQEMVRQQALTGAIAQSRAEARVQTVHDALAAEGLLDWASSAIPSAVGDAYVGMVAAEIAPVHGKPAAADAGEGGRALIRRVVLSGTRGLALAVDKVRSAHDELVAAGVVSWEINAVPVAFAEEYVTLGASMLGPVYGQKPGGDVFGEVAGRLRAAGQVRDAEERALQRVQSVQAELNTMGLVTWGSDAIPASMADAITSTATSLMAIEGGKADPAAVEAGYARIRLLAMSGPYGQARAEEALRAVHYELEAWGRTRWTLVNIPRFVEEPYVMLAAVRLAPEVGRPADPAWEPRAMMSLVKATALPTTHEPVVTTYF